MFKAVILPLIVPTHSCRKCGGIWVEHSDSWQAYSVHFGPCCDMVAMDKQIAPLSYTGTNKRLGALHPSIAAILPYFHQLRYNEPLLDDVSRLAIYRIVDTAWVVANGAQVPETTVALRKLLEAADCVRRLQFHHS